MKQIVNTAILTIAIGLASCSNKVVIEDSLIGKSVITIRNESLKFEEYRPLDSREYCGNLFLKRMDRNFDCWVLVHSGKKYLVIGQRVQFKLSK